ncbi:SGNH/GDSL hydrolase family protein [Nonomuraea sp. WAC 01424]|uniref:SGNH/GDSL hydrolase family protein n=1 Tax=Nonomuraea sp. WAC 01424 TaxID=2203200 RepID=UPI00163C172C|nr:SGNH/GDSL hydrolase family protein [Nonomuraea sp. WAC 01424]
MKRWGVVRVVAVAAALGAALALLGVPLGVYPKLACAVLSPGCATDPLQEPRGRLPRLTRLTPVQVALSGTYVALGDSYSSGEGVYEQDGSPVNGGADRCHRARGSYVPLVAGAHDFSGGNAFYACSGATTRQLLSGQYGQQPQITRVDPSASLITLSIGGNDAGFTDVLTGCIVKLPWSSACVDQDAEVAQRIDELRPSLFKVLGELRARAPRARVIVLGYPRPFPASPSQAVDNLGVADQRWLNTVTRKLNDTVGAVTAQYDRGLAGLGAPGSVEYVDAYEAFTGHEAGTAQPYLNSLALDVDALTVNARSYHPTGDGYRRFAELINRQIAAGPGRPLHNFQTAAP